MISPIPDRNFDDIAKRFTRTIYDTMKGRIRLAALQQDFQDFHLPMAGQSVIDIGGGQGQFSLWLAKQGSTITLCDLSQEMLSMAKAYFAQEQLTLTTHCLPLQRIPATLPEQYDIVLNHAVLEWLEQPLEALPILASKVKPQGWLSLMFYNEYGHVWRHLMNGVLDTPMQSTEKLRKKGNAPQHPLRPEQIEKELTQLGFEIVRWRGVRNVYEHMPQKMRERHSEAELINIDLQYGLLEPYRRLSRYIHFLARKR